MDPYLSMSKILHNVLSSVLLLFSHRHVSSNHSSYGRLIVIVGVSYCWNQHQPTSSDEWKSSSRNWGTHDATSWESTVTIPGHKWKVHTGGGHEIKDLKQTFNLLSLSQVWAWGQTPHAPARSASLRWGGAKGRALPGPPPPDCLCYINTHSELLLTSSQSYSHI